LTPLGSKWCFYHRRQAAARALAVFVIVQAMALRLGFLGVLPGASSCVSCSCTRPLAGHHTMGLFGSHVLK
jgi:hypothetical protein